MYREFSPEEFVPSVTYQPLKSLDAFQRGLEAQKQATEDSVMKWKDVELTTDGESVLINGMKVHPYVLWRLSSHLIGVKKNRWEQWQDNPELLVSSLKVITPMQPDQEVMIRSVFGQVLYCTDMVMDLGHHSDYFDVMVNRFSQSASRIRMPAAVLGYLDDPLWTHVKLIYLPYAERTYFTGFQFDVNYLFSRSLRGRASMSMFAHDLMWNSTLNLDSWWSIRSMPMRGKGDMLASFQKAVDMRKNVSLGEKLRTTTSKLTTIKSQRSRQDWRQETVLQLGGKYISRSKIRDGLLNYDESSKRNPLDFSFALSSQLKDLPLERRMEAERVLANRLKSI